MSSAILEQPVSSPILADRSPVCVLLVSPNADLRRDLASRLRSTRWEVHEVASGASAIEKIHAGIGSLILLDPALPDLRVDEFRQFLAVDFPEVEIIPINSHTGRPIPAAPPNSLCFELVRALERHGSFSVDNGAYPPAMESPGAQEQGLPGWWRNATRPC
jgi:hypothetical protein